MGVGMILKTINTKVSNYVVEGYENDYVFQTIKNTNNFYEISILDKWTPKFSEAKIIFDIGSNIGNHTLYWSEKLNYEAIYAFEPFKPTFERLNNNIKNNNMKNIFAVNKGVGNVNGFANTSFIDESNMGATTLEYSKEQNEDTMEIISIDDFVVENNIKNIDFVKIDTESFELFVLEGMKKVLREMKPDLWIEVGTQTYKKVMDDLKELNYIPVDIEGFNILFLNASRHEELNEYDSEVVLKNMFIYLEKTNAYYKNYLKCKGWLQGKNNQLEKQKEAYASNLETLKKVQEENKKLNEDKNQLAGIVENLINDLNDEISILKESKALINKLETQKNYLKHENDEYRRKLSLITDTFIGEIGVKTYKGLKKIKNKLKKVVHKFVRFKFHR